MRLAILLICCTAALGQTSTAPPSEQKPKAPDYGLAVGTRGKQFTALDILSNTQGVDFGPYLRGLLENVRNNWYRLIPESAATKKAKLAIEFAITKDGKLADMRLVAASGDTQLDHASWGSITACGPFKPLPEKFTGPYLSLRMRFYYNRQKRDAVGFELANFLAFPALLAYGHVIPQFLARRKGIIVGSRYLGVTTPC